MHQLSQRRCAFLISPLTQIICELSLNGLPRFLIVLSIAYRGAAFQHIVLRYEDHIGFMEVFKLLSDLRYICVENSAVKSGALWRCAGILTLHFDVVLPVFTVCRVNIQPNAAALQVFYNLLCLYSFSDQVRLVEHNAEHKLSTFDVI